VGAGALSEADVRTIEKDVNDIIDEAVAFADASPEPPAEWLFTDIYKD
jgi:TPP-dependent pyruvate/acetoin dehydrogenase alpha subunit